MAIKVTPPETKQEPKPFPKLMVDENECIFYMVRENYGLPLTGDSWGFHLPYFADFSDNSRVFTDYNDPITIQNA